MASVVSMGVGLSVLIGWALDLRALIQVFPGLIPMNPLTAVTFILAGTTLGLESWKPTPLKHRWALGLAFLVLTFGLLRLIGYAWDWTWNLDQVLFADKLAQHNEGYPNRMSPNTALCFVVLGSALLCLRLTTARGNRPTEWLALGLLFASLLALMGYAYEVPWLYGILGFIPMALNTAVVFHVLAVGLFFAKREAGLTSLLLSRSPGGALARRFIPSMVLCLSLLGWLLLQGERRGLFSAEMGATLFAIITIALMTVLTWFSARSLHRADELKQQMEAEKQRFFSLSLDMLCIAGTDGYFKRINPAFTETLGYTTAELMSRPYLELVHPDDREATMVETGQINEGRGNEHFENRYRCKDGTWKWLWWKGKTFPEEGLIYAIARDITEQKLVQESIQQLNRSLEERAQQLDMTNHELEAFSYSVSHDLRAPLRGISGFAQALEEQVGASLDPTSHGYLQRVRRAADRMGLLIDDLLKLSRLTRTEMHLESVDVSAMAESILERLQQADPQRVVDISIETGIRLQADAALLQILLENLLENAWKFTSKNPEAKIELGQKRDGDNAKICYVKDNGVGFDMRYSSKLFGAFQRLHSMAEFPGTGIGLATVQRVARRHGGKVWAEGETNAGSTFYFMI